MSATTDMTTLDGHFRPLNKLVYVYTVNTYIGFHFSVRKGHTIMFVFSALTCFDRVFPILFFRHDNKSSKNMSLSRLSSIQKVKRMVACQPCLFFQFFVAPGTVVGSSATLS